MSLVPVGISLGEAAALNLFNFILIRPRAFVSNTFGIFVPNVTVEEIGRDKLTVTDHPVEQNANISDHAFKQPCEVVLKVGYSNSSLQASGNPNYDRDTYQSFLTLQASRQLVGIFTGKRTYVNMLIEDILMRNDERTEYALMMEVACREVFLVQTQVSQLPQNNVQADSKKTGGVTNTGASALVPNPSGFNASAVPQ